MKTVNHPILFIVNLSLTSLKNGYESIAMLLLLARHDAERTRAQGTAGVCCRSAVRSASRRRTVQTSAMAESGHDPANSSSVPLAFNNFLEKMRHPSASELVKSVKVSAPASRISSSVAFG